MDDFLRKPKWYVTFMDVAIVLVVAILWVAICVGVKNLINPNEGKNIERYKDFPSRQIIFTLYPYS